MAAIIDEFSVELAVDKGRSTITIEGYRGKSEKVTVPASIGGIPVTAIGPHAFSGKKDIKEITLPEGIVSIGYNSFENCMALTSINLPESLVSIDDSAFKKLYAAHEYQFTKKTD